MLFVAKLFSLYLDLNNYVCCYFEDFFGIVYQMLEVCVNFEIFVTASVVSSSMKVLDCLLFCGCCWLISLVRSVRLPVCGCLFEWHLFAELLYIENTPGIVECVTFLITWCFLPFLCAFPFLIHRFSILLFDALNLLQLFYYTLLLHVYLGVLFCNSGEDFRFAIRDRWRANAWS